MQEETKLNDVDKASPPPDNVTLGYVLPQEIERCKKLLDEYINIGPAGIFGANMIKIKISNAEKAIINGDIVEMVRSYARLKECE